MNNTNVTNPLKKIAIINYELPFFAYGIFKKGEIAYYKIKNVIKEEPQEAFCKGMLYEKDGVPIFANFGNEKIRGTLTYFKNPQEGYALINSIEPFNLYCWSEIWTTKGIKVNILIARQSIVSNDDSMAEYKMPGAKPRHDEEWHCSKDPLFVHGMDFLRKRFFDKIIEEEPLLHGEESSRYEGVFLMQMAYTFLWSIIDRHNTLKYALTSKDIAVKNKKLANDKDFIKTTALLKGHFLTKDDSKVVDSTTGESASFKPKQQHYETESEAIIKYYYGIRNNAVHRGKVSTDRDNNDLMRLKDSFLELYAIMENVISMGIHQGKDDTEAIDLVIKYGTSIKR